jgi:hypothetical protein
MFRSPRATVNFVAHLENRELYKPRLRLSNGGGGPGLAPPRP